MKIKGKLIADSTIEQNSEITGSYNSIIKNYVVGFSYKKIIVLAKIS
jgi:hypothetical protein